MAGRLANAAAMSAGSSAGAGLVLDRLSLVQQQARFTR
jgi:hypothetical protein